MAGKAFNPDLLPFDESLQLAALGHCLKAPEAFAQMRGLGITDKHFLGQYAAMVWRELIAFAGRGRHPTPTEVSKLTVVGEEADVVKSFQRTVADSLAMCDQVGLDALLPVVQKWRFAAIVHEGGYQLVDAYNRSDVMGAVESVRRIYERVRDVDRALLDGARPVSERVKEEQAKRLAEIPRILNYGISYVDDATGGIIPNDLVLVGAKPGIGKTTLVTAVAMATALRKKRVTFFALEAEPYEVERHLKYLIVSGLYARDRPDFADTSGFINYADWRQGKLQSELGPYEAQAEREMDTHLKTLKTLYRTAGDFTVKTLDRMAHDAANDSDLIIVDHIHYVDVEEDENAEYKKAIKVLRDIAINRGVPVIVVAHLRKSKEARRHSPLLPQLEEFHGTSDLTKIATTCIILGPADVVPMDENLKYPAHWATYMQISKNRLEGSRTRYTGVSFFNPRLGQYIEQYALGRLVNMDRDWEPVLESKRPHWAKHATVQLAG